MESLSYISGFREEFLEEPYIQHLHALIHTLTKRVELQEKQIDELTHSLRKLKKLPQAPKLKASKLDNPLSKTSKTTKKRKKRQKQKNLPIHETIQIKGENIPSDWKFMGYKKRIIQDFVIKPHNIEYQLEIWRNPVTGNCHTSKLPSSLQNTHFGQTLKAYILHQYYYCGVTQPLLYSSLRDFGVDISAGQINAILTEKKEYFHEEKETLLQQAISLKEELRTDDTGAFHLFKNASCNCINSDLFTYFTTTFSKNRINFLNILRQENKEYTLNQEALDYLQRYRFSSIHQQLLQEYQQGKVILPNKEAFNEYCKKHQITAEHTLIKVEEAFLMGTLIEKGFSNQTLIHSDGAYQFNLFEHSLCWKHAERPLVNLKIYNAYQEKEYQKRKHKFWTLYQNLKLFKNDPSPQKAKTLEKDFDDLCEETPFYFSLNEVLKNLKKQKEKLLKVLIYPQVSLHNNDSERDIREMVKRRKISGSTRSENGRKAKDTFLSLKKTCLKLGVSFWEYLLDRINQEFQIEPLKDLMLQKRNTLIQ